VAHLLRELTCIKETCAEQQQWTDPLAKLLLEIKTSGERVRAAGGPALTEEQQAKFFRRYDRIVTRAARLNPAPGPPPPPDKGVPRRKVPKLVRKKNPAVPLIKRLRECREEVLRFMTDLAVPFDRYERRRSRAHSPGPTEPHSFGFGGLLRLAGWRTASAHHARQLLPACRRSSRALVELGSALACDH
jgi:hypothetical protein